MENIAGKYVIVQTTGPEGFEAYYAGVAVGTSFHGVELLECRRLWSWFAARSIGIGAVAKYGLCKKRKSRVCPETAWAILKDWTIILPCTQLAEISIRKQHDTKQDNVDSDQPVRINR